MSSVSISQILQIASAKADAKPQPLSQPQGDEFERVLARVSGNGEQRPTVAAKAGEAPEAEQPLSDDSEQDAATTPDDQSAPTDVAVTAIAEGEEAVPADDLLLDEIELSEAAAIAVATHVPAAVEYPVEAVHAIADGELVPEPSVAQEASAKQQAAVPDFSRTFDAAPEAAQVGASEPVVVDPTVKTSPEEPASAHTEINAAPANELDAGMSTNAATQRVESQTVEAPPVQATVDVAPKALGKSPKVAPQQAKQTVVAETDEAAAPADETESAAKPEPIAIAAPVKPELIAAGEAKVSGEEKPAPELRAAEVSPTRHESSDSRSQAAGAPDASRGDANTLVDTDPVSTADRVRFVQRVSRAFQTAQSREGIIQLRLSPPELGSLKIAISTHQGILSAKVETETAAARNVILDNLPALRERLAEQQIRLERFDVDVRRDGGQSPGNWEAADRQPRDSNNNSGANRVRQAPAAAPRVARTVGGVADGSLDVRI